MKNHNFHENKNPCPDFNGEKMLEHPRNVNEPCSFTFFIKIAFNNIKKEISLCQHF